MNAPLVQVEGLAIDYASKRRYPWSAPGRVRAVDGVDLQIEAGRTLGLVGESGSGKSTIGRAVLGDLVPAAGSIRVGEWDVGGLRGRPPFAYRQAVQMVWQNPYASLTPTMPVGEQISEPMRREPRGDAAARRRRVAELLEQVGMREADADKLPHEFSGGQRQRIAIARALVLKPSLIVLDEPVSALDVITQSQILKLLEEVQASTGVAYLLISHDIGVVRYLAQELLVLHHGRVVERGAAEEVCARPTHPYTQELIDSVLEPGPLDTRASDPLARDDGPRAYPRAPKGPQSVASRGG